jgi:hypothetical protein
MLQLDLQSISKVFCGDSKSLASDMRLNHVGLLDRHLRFCQRRPISDANRGAYTPYFFFGYVFRNIHFCMISR